MRSLLAAAVGADHVLAVGDFPPDYGRPGQQEDLPGVDRLLTLSDGVVPSP